MGHVSAVCTSSAVCSRCSESHSTETCHAEHRKCSNCHGPHDASSKACPNMKKEMQVLRQMVRDGSTHREAAAKVRRRRSRRRRTSRKPSTEARDARAPQTAHPPQQAPISASNKHHKNDTRIIGPPDAWPALPSINPPAEPQHRSLKVTSERVGGDSQDQEVIAMVKTLMNTIRILLNNIQTPAARSALQILDALNPVLSSLGKHHGSSSAALQ